MMPPKLEIAIRSGGESDLGLLYDSWLRALRAMPSFASVPTEHFYRSQHLLIDHLLARPTSVFACATPDIEDAKPSDLAGVALGEPARGILHWVFVKSPYRDQGHGGTLIRAVAGNLADVKCTHWTPGARAMATKYGLRYSPGDLRDPVTTVEG